MQNQNQKKDLSKVRYTNQKALKNTPDKSSRRSGGWLPLVISALILLRMPSMYGRMIIYYFFRSPFPLRNLELLLRHPFQQPGLGIIIYALAVIVLVISLIRVLIGIGRGSGAKTRVEKKTEKEIETIEKSFQSAYKSGRERYMDQLDGFLKSGYLDQKGYNEMKKKYQEMNIPNGF